MKKTKINRNVWLTNYFTLADGLAMGMWNYAILGMVLTAVTQATKSDAYAEQLLTTASTFCDTNHVNLHRSLKILKIDECRPVPV
jgi:hypothetical protein